jgi:hypothetical protein
LQFNLQALIITALLPAEKTGMNIESWLISGIGGTLILLFGVVLFCWGRKEASDDYAALSEHTDAHNDVKKFLDGGSDNYGPVSLKMGGVIAVIIGSVLILLTLILALLGD